MTLADANYHKRLLEMCTCYMNTDFLLQMKQMVNSKSADVEEDALKYLALAMLYVISEKERKLTFKKKPGKLSVTIKGEGKNALPIPPAEVFVKIFDVMRGILHLEDDKGKMNLAVGLQNDSIDVEVKMEKSADKETLKFKFPSL